MAKRGDALELAVLGLLHETPMHGYELRKRLNGVLGWGRVLSYGSLYPCLKQLLARRADRRGHRRPDVADGDRGEPARARSSTSSPPRARSASRRCVARAGPSAWEDDSFGVHFAFFGPTDAETRLRILEGRRSRLEERSTASARRWPAPASGSTATPSSCSGTASSRSSARSAGSPS